MIKWLFFFVCGFGPLLAETKSIDYESGLHYYQDGERAKQPEERKKAFNMALSSYLHLKHENPSGMLLYDIGNCYYQLGEYGLAVLYYYRAMNKLPRDDRIYTNLRVTREKVGFEMQPRPNSLFLWLSYTMYERSLGLIACLLSAFAFFSFHLWHPHAVFLRLSYLTSFGALLFTATLLWGSYFSPIAAVVVSPTSLFQGPGYNYIRTSKAPLQPGTKVRVIEVTNDGTWMNVELSSGERGYVSGQEAQVI